MRCGFPTGCVAVVLACVPMQARAQDEGLDLRPADQAARAWLATVDSGRYGDSWEDAAALFKQAIPKLRWETTVQSVREPLGVVVGRKVRAMNYTRILPGRARRRVRGDPVRHALREPPALGGDGDADAGEGRQLEGVGILHPLSERSSGGFTRRNSRHSSAS